MNCGWGRVMEISPPYGCGPGADPAKARRWVYVVGCGVRWCSPVLTGIIHDSVPGHNLAIFVRFNRSKF